MAVLRGSRPHMIFFFQSLGGTFFYGVEEVAYFSFVGGDHAFEDGAAGAGSAGDEDLLENCGSGGYYVRLFGEASEKRRPIFDAIVGDAEEADVGGGSDEALLQILAKAVVDGEGDDERGYAGGDPNDRNAGDDADEGLPSFCSQVSGCDEEFEAHGSGFQPSRIIASESSSWGRRQNKSFQRRGH